MTPRVWADERGARYRGRVGQGGRVALVELELRLDRPYCGCRLTVLSAIVAEVGENIHAGQPVLVIEETASGGIIRCARRSAARPHGGVEGRRRTGGRARANTGPVTELVPLGLFAHWQAERAIGDYDRNTLRLALTRWAIRPGWSPA